MAYAILAWLIAAVCLAIMGVRIHRLARLELPTAWTLLERLSSGSDAVRRAELDDYGREIAGAARVGAELPRALARVSLASGAALALLAWIRNAMAPSWSSVVLALVAGWTGALGIAVLGRIAGARSRKVCEHWARVTARARSILDNGSGFRPTA